MDFLQTCVTELLHIDDWRHNKLIDLNGDLRQTYFLDRVGEETAPYALRTLAARLGKPANTVLRGSALTAEEQRIGRNQNTFDWRDGLGVRDARALGAFIADTYRELNLKGNNPLFLGVGALEWRVPVGNGAMQTVLSPLLVFPVRLVRASSATPVSLEFVDDDAYFNPCLRQKLRQLSRRLPLPRLHPSGLLQSRPHRPTGSHGAQRRTGPPGYSWANRRYGPPGICRAHWACWGDRGSWTGWTDWPHRRDRG